jgi:arylsulfatase A-like enzyme/Tfp pilus assembly protein PilF
MGRRILLVVFVAMLGTLACAPAARTPGSMIVITIDTLRPDHVNARVTPALDRLAREAVVFEYATTVAPVTLPAHASMLTGTFPPAHGVRDNTIYSLPEGTATFATSLRSRGYATAAFVSAVVLDRRYGLSHGFDTYDDAVGHNPERRAADTLASARQWISGSTTTAGKPFFVWIHLFEPHAPYLSGSYANEVSVVDTELDAFFSWLREKDLWDSLVLSVTSDHGESLGEHGEQTHGFFVYDATVRIPWILKAKSLTPGRFSPHVRIVDVLPTMIAAAAAGTPPEWALDGIDLLPHLRSGQDPRLDGYAETFLPRHQFQWSELKSVRAGDVKYIQAPRPEAYDLRSDPAEQRNVAAERAADTARLKTLLGAIERRRAVASTSAAPQPELEEKFMSLGYIGGSPLMEGTSGEGLPDPKDRVEVYALTMSALELSESGKPQDALAALEKAERLDPGVTQIHYLKGTILGGQERYADAARALERTVALNPRHVTARFRLALAYLRLSRLDEAEKTLRSVLADEPRNVRAHHNLATIAYSRGELARAEELERQAIAIDPNYFEAWNTLGAIYIASGQPDAAVSALNTALGLNPSSEQARHNLALAMRARR